MDIDRTMEDNVGLVWQQLHKLNLVKDEEAYSYGLEGLWRAAQTYDGSAAFSTYASVCIYNAICMYLRPKRNKKQLVIVSYDTPIDSTDNNSESLSYFITNNETPETILVQKELNSAMYAIVERLLSALPNSPKRLVLQQWYASHGSATQQDLAAASGLTQSYVSRLIADFRHKIRKELEAYL